MNTKTKCPKCAMCGATVRNSDYVGYEEQALCRRCEKERDAAAKDN